MTVNEDALVAAAAPAHAAATHEGRRTGQRGAAGCGGGGHQGGVPSDGPSCKEPKTEEPPAPTPLAAAGWGAGLSAASGEPGESRSDAATSGANGPATHSARTVQSNREDVDELVARANGLRVDANAKFADGRYDDALNLYRDAVDLLPVDRPERALVLGNMAACYLKQEKFAEAAAKATDALTANPTYTKALLRRAQANEQIGSWSSLTSSLEDYKKLGELDSTSREARLAVERLPPRIEMQQQKEREEMIGKLKGLGNSILGKFGLSTDNFQMVPNGEGGYSVSFKK